jgi:hypothetical protein
MPSLCEVCADTVTLPITKNTEILLNAISSYGDCTNISYTSTEELTQVLHNLHISDIFNITEDDDELPEEDEINDLITPDSQHDITDIAMTGTAAETAELRILCDEFADIFSLKIRVEPARVPALNFDFDKARWHQAANRLPSRRISPEKQAALNVMIDELLDIGAIRVSTATAWSQVHLVKKPKGGWRCTIDFRGLNKVISNQGWQIPNMSSMLERIGSTRPSRFVLADLTSGYHQMPLHEDCIEATAFITFRGIFEWRRVAMGLLPSANYFQRTMQQEVLKELMYVVCEVYIDDLLIPAQDFSDLLKRTRKVWQRLRDKNVTVNPRKVEMGNEVVQFVGHELDKEGINMAQKRIESTINILQPQNLVELQSFVGVINYFRDHLENASTRMRPLIDMIKVANSTKSRYIVWTDDGHHAFQNLKDGVNACPKLYFISYAPEFRIFLCTDASDYAFGAYLYQEYTDTKGNRVEQPIRFLSQSFRGAQLNWSVIEKEAYAIYIALQRFDELLGGVHFTIRTDHNNLIFLNNAGSKKVLGWKLAIQGFDFHIEHIKGIDNIPADAFSRQVARWTPDEVIINSTIVRTTCTDLQRSRIKTCHEFYHAHWGVDKTIDFLIQNFPEDTLETVWPDIKHDVRLFVRSCPTCQKMSPLQAVIKATPFYLSTLQPMSRIAIDTIGPIGHDPTAAYIITLIDTFTRYVELFATPDCSAISAATALWTHIDRFGVPLELVTDQGSQFMNSLMSELTNAAGIRHIGTIPYSKEENGLVERCNKEVNRHLRNIFFDTDIQSDWSSYLSMTQMLLNSSIKQPLGVSPNTLLFGGAIDQQYGLLTEIDRAKSQPLRSMRSYLDDLLTRQNRLISAAIRSQTQVNTDNVNKRYRRYQPKNRPSTHRHLRGTKLPVSVNHLTSQHDVLTSITWVREGDTSPPRYRREQVNIQGANIPLSEIDVSVFEPTQFEIGDYVLRAYPPTKAGKGPPNKYGSYWRGPYLVTHKVFNPDSHKYIYTIYHLVTTKSSKVDIMHLKPFYYDPQYVEPLTIAVKDTEEFVVESIVEHNTTAKPSLWKVRWLGYDASEDTWEPYNNIKNVEAFHNYCVTHNLLHHLPPYIVRP